MIRLEKFRKAFVRSQNISFIKNKSTTSDINLEKLENESTIADKFLTEDNEAKLREENIEKSRNKSGLFVKDRNILHEINPYPEPQFWHHGTIKYLRRTYGRYGVASGVNPSICWPIKEELQDKQEYERVAFPFSIPQMIEQASQQKKEKQERILKRQQGVVEKLKKLEQWKQDLYNRIQKKENEMKAAKEQREKLVEEVRRHFGFTVDPHDEKFKEMLEKKEKEQKKAKKEARRKAREDQMLEDLKKKSNVEQGENEKDKEVSVDK